MTGVGLPRVLAQAQGASGRVNILLSGPSLGLGPIDLHICVRVRVHTHTHALDWFIRRGGRPPLEGAKTVVS